MQIKKSEMVNWAKTMTAKQIAEFLTAQCGETVTLSKVNSVLKQLNIKAKGSRGSQPFTIVDDSDEVAPPQAEVINGVVVNYASNSDDLTLDQQEHLFANND